MDASKFQEVVDRLERRCADLELKVYAQEDQITEALTASVGAQIELQKMLRSVPWDLRVTIQRLGERVGASEGKVKFLREDVDKGERGREFADRKLNMTRKELTALKKEVEAGAEPGKPEGQNGKPPGRNKWSNAPMPGG